MKNLLPSDPCFVSSSIRGMNSYSCSTWWSVRGLGVTQNSPKEEGGRGWACLSLSFSPLVLLMLRRGKTAPATVNPDVLS